MSISMSDARYRILEQIWKQENSKTDPYYNAKFEYIKNKILSDPDYLKDRETYLRLKEEGYMDYLENSNYDLDFVEDGISIYRNNEFYFGQKTEEFCVRKDNKFIYSLSFCRMYEEIFTEEEMKYLESLDVEINRISKAYEVLKDKMDACKSFAELASIPEISNFFDKTNPKKFRKKAKLREDVVNA